MGTKIVAVVLALGGVVYAVSPPSRGLEGAAVAATLAVLPSVRDTSPAAVDRTDVGSNSLMRGELQVRAGAPMQFVLRVTNTGRKQTELRFPDGQTHEFVVRDAAEREVWRWSAGRMFTQALRTRAIDGGETVEFAERVSAVMPAGQYTVTAQLRSDNHPLEVRRMLSVP